MFAFGLTAWDWETESIEDPTIGTLRPFYKTWNADSEAPNFEALDYHQCSRAELQLPDEEISPDEVVTQFFPLKSDVDLDYYFAKMMCLDQTKQISIQGDYNTAEARQLILLFDRCSNSTSTDLYDLDDGTQP